MTTNTATSVVTSTVVDAPIERAFTVFTDGMPTWWPEDHHLIEGPLAEMVFEPRVGGGIIDRGTDGGECRWARILVLEPPVRVVFSWDIDADWTPLADLERASEVEVRFEAEGPGRTRVTLEHRHLDRLGEGWEGMRDAVGSSRGWPDWSDYRGAVERVAG